MLANTMKKVTWMARATTTIVGLAIMLALVLGVATTALAGTGVGARFDLGKVNTVNAVTKLVGSVAGPSLTIDNNSANANATALDLQVEAGKAPMKVNSGAQVANLNADKLDGQDAADLQGLSDARVSSTTVSTKAGAFGSGTARCAPEEVATGGGVELLNGAASEVHYNMPGGIPQGNPPVAWFATWFAEADNVLGDTVVRVHVVCAS